MSDFRRLLHGISDFYDRDFYDRCFDEGIDEDSGPYEDPMYRDLEEKPCSGCGHTTLFRPGEGFCESCADKRERGAEMVEAIDG